MSGAGNQTKLDDRDFIRARLFENDQSVMKRYAGLVLARPGWLRLIHYEITVALFGPIPGALGLALRKIFFPPLFRSVGSGVVFGRNIELHHPDNTVLGDGVVLGDDCSLGARGAGDSGLIIGDRVIVSRGAMVVAKSGQISIGDDSNVGASAKIISQGPIRIGRSVSIAGNAMIAGGRYVVAQSDTPDRKERFTSGEISIGEGTRIGMGAIIQDAVRIGRGAIVAPGSVVFSDVADNGVVWGNPARPVRSRAAGSVDGGSTPADPAEPTRRAAAEHAVVAKQVCEFLAASLFVEFDDELTVADSLVDRGVIDSVDLVRLLSWAEEAFDVDLAMDELEVADIDSVDKIVARIVERAGT